MNITLGFSPCPNDTFIFDALVNGKIDTEGLHFDVVLEDVQTLNQWAAKGKLDITKMSFPALFANTDRYACLSSGAALGKGVGPLLIAKSMVGVRDIEHCTIAVPGETTTAAFLLNYAFPTAKEKKAYLFSSIEDAVLNGEVDMGVIIHENRFTYQQRGLVKVLDLGEYWEVKTGSAIPLGCIGVKRSMDIDVQKKIERLIRTSLEMAQAAYPHISEYVRAHAQAMDELVMRQHIDLYVNDHSIDLGDEGVAAINVLYQTYLKQHPGLQQSPLFS